MDQEDADENGDLDDDDFSGYLRNLVDKTTNDTSSVVGAQTCEDISLAICAENLSVKAGASHHLFVQFIDYAISRGCG